MFYFDDCLMLLFYEDKNNSNINNIKNNPAGGSEVKVVSQFGERLPTSPSY